MSKGSGFWAPGAGLVVVGILTAVAGFRHGGGRRASRRRGRVILEMEGFAPAEFPTLARLAVEQEVIELREGGDPLARKLPGKVAYPNLVLKRELRPADELWQWRRRVAGGAAEARNGSVLVFGADGRLAATYHIHRAWPAKWQISDLDATGNEVAIETIELAIEGFDRAE